MMTIMVIMMIMMMMMMMTLGQRLNFAVASGTLEGALLPPGTSEKNYHSGEEEEDAHLVDDEDHVNHDDAFYHRRQEGSDITEKG